MDTELTDEQIRQMALDLGLDPSDLSLVRATIRRSTNVQLEFDVNNSNNSVSY